MNLFFQFSGNSTPEVKAGGQNAPTSAAALQNLLAGLATSGSGMGQMFGLQQPQLLAAFATAMAAMAGGGGAGGAGGNSPSAHQSPPPPPVSMAPTGLAGLFGNAMADQAQAMQTFAQLQSMFLPNPAAAAQMMNMQQVRIKLFYITYRRSHMLFQIGLPIVILEEFLFFSDDIF